MLDESAFFNITAEVEPRTLFEFLARETHTEHLVVLYGLIKNAVFPDWELTLLLPVPERLRGDLEVAAEVTYSRISTLAEWFYERTFAELLTFRIAFAEPQPPSKRLTPKVPLPRSQAHRPAGGASPPSRRRCSARGTRSSSASTTGRTSTRCPGR